MITRVLFLGIDLEAIAYSLGAIAWINSIMMGAFIFIFVLRE